jgi:hypothetical protein
MADDALPPLPKPKYGLLKPQPLIHQQVSYPGASEINSQVDQSSSDPEASQSVVSFSKSSSSTTNTIRYQEQDRHQPEQGQSRLGRDIQTGRVVDVPQASRRQGLYILGLQGYGKSGLIENLVIQDIKQGIGVCVLDPKGNLKGNLIDNIIARLPAKREKDVIYFDMTDMSTFFGLPLLDCADLQDELSVENTRNQFLHVFEKAFGITAKNPVMYTLLSNIAYTLIANPGYTMIDIRQLLTNRTWREKLLQNRFLKEHKLHVVDSWDTHYDHLSPQKQDEERFYILNKLNDFENAPLRYIVGQAQSTINMQEIIDTGKILLVRLNSKRLEQATSLIGSIIVALILNASDTRTTNNQFNLYADEFQRFASEDFVTLIEEARYAGIGITMAHQNRGQLELSEELADKNLKQRTLNVGNLVVFRVPTDAESLAGQFAQKPEEAWIQVNKPQRHRRIEEQVEVEVEEEIEEISQTPFDHLTRNSHKNVKVREAVQAIKRPTYFPLAPDMPTEPLAVYLTAFPEHRGVDRNPLIGSEYFNALLVDVMEGRLSLGTNALAVRIFPIVQSLTPYIKWLGSGAVGATWWYASEDLPSHITTLISKGYMTKEDYEKYTRGLRREGEEPEVYKRLFALIWGLVSGQGQLDRLKQDMADALSDVFVLKIGGNLYHYYSKRVYEIEKAKDSYYKLAEAEKEIERTHSQVKESVSKATQIITEWTPLIVNGVVTYVSHWLTLCEELAKEENHIKVGTGQKRMVKRIQPHITYLPEESEKITHPQPSEQEMTNRMARELINLPLYTARVKITTAAGIEEHAIQTLEPEKGIRGVALQGRIARIQTRNRDDGYTRLRQEIEAEIRLRQTKYNQPPDEPPEEEPPVQRHPQR